MGLTGFVLAMAIGTMLFQGYLNAADLDGKIEGAFSTDPCFNPLQDAVLERRIMTLKESQTLTVILAANSTTGCQATVKIQAPNFESSEAYWTRTVKVPPMGEPIESVWVLLPRGTGTFKIAVSTNDLKNARLQRGVSVIDILGYPASWLQVFIIAGLILGPMLSLPWWFDRLRLNKPQA